MAQGSNKEQGDKPFYIKVYKVYKNKYFKRPTHLLSNEQNDRFKLQNFSKQLRRKGRTFSSNEINRARQ